MDFLRLRLPGLHQALRGALVREGKEILEAFSPSLECHLSSPLRLGAPFLQSVSPGFQSPPPPPASISACMYSRLGPILALTQISNGRFLTWAFLV